MTARRRRPVAAAAAGVLGLVAATVPLSATAQPSDPWRHPMMGWGGPFTGMLMMVIFVAAVATAVLLVRYLWNIGHGQDHTSPTTGRGTREEVLAILDKRYARGEIDREDYLQRKADLEGSSEV